MSQPASSVFVTVCVQFEVYWWFLKTSTTAPESEVGHALEAPVAAERLAEQPRVGARRQPVDRVVGAHDAERAALDDGGAERGQVRRLQVELGHRGVDGVPRDLAARAPVALERVGVKALERHHRLHVARVERRALQPLGHLGAEAAADRRVLGRRLEVTAPARVTHDADVRAPAVKADVGKAIGVVLADALQPERAELDADHLAHATPDRPVEARAERVGVWEGRGAAAVVGAARLHAVDAVSSPVVLRDAEAAHVAPRRVACDEERRLLLEGEQREQVVDPGLQWQLRVAEAVCVVWRSAGTGDA